MAHLTIRVCFHHYCVRVSSLWKKFSNCYSSPPLLLLGHKLEKVLGEGCSASWTEVRSFRGMLPCLSQFIPIEKLIKSYKHFGAISI